MSCVKKHGCMRHAHNDNPKRTLHRLYVFYSAHYLEINLMNFQNSARRCAWHCDDQCAPRPTLGCCHDRKAMWATPPSICASRHASMTRRCRSRLRSSSPATLGDDSGWSVHRCCGRIMVLCVQAQRGAEAAPDIFMDWLTRHPLCCRRTWLSPEPALNGPISIVDWRPLY